MFNPNSARSCIIEDSSALKMIILRFRPISRTQSTRSTTNKLIHQNEIARLVLIGRKNAHLLLHCKLSCRTSRSMSCSSQLAKSTKRNRTGGSSLEYWIDNTWHHILQSSLQLQLRENHAWAVVDDSCWNSPQRLCKERPIALTTGRCTSHVLHMPTSPTQLPRALALHTLNGCVGTLPNGYARSAPLPRLWTDAHRTYQGCTSLAESHPSVAAKPHQITQQPSSLRPKKATLG